MIVHCPHDELVPLKDLKPHPHNRNRHPQEQIDRLAKILRYQGWRYPIKVSKRSGYITSGHGRLQAAELNGWFEAPVSFQDYDTEEQEYADLQADNAIASWAALDLSAINLDLGELGPDFDIDLLGIQDLVIEPLDKLDIDRNNPYTNKIKAPTYTPTGPKPSASALYDESKTLNLVQEIEAADLKPEIKQFLKKAAERHTVFDYQQIAEFYAHENKQVQELMEKSALVIIDFDKAIENGFIKLTKDLAEQFDVEV